MPNPPGSDAPLGGHRPHPSGTSRVPHDDPRGTAQGHATRFPDTSWSTVSFEGDGLASSLGPRDVDAIKICVGRDGANTEAWEFTQTRVRLRYKDLPPDQDFACPTAPTFAAMKLAAWSDRHAPRDLFDLAGLAALGTLRDPNVNRIFTAKKGVPILAADFARVPARTADRVEHRVGSASWSSAIGRGVPRAGPCRAAAVA